MNQEAVTDPRVRFVLFEMLALNAELREICFLWHISSSWWLFTHFTTNILPRHTLLFKRNSVL